LTGIIDIVLIQNMTENRGLAERKLVAERIADYGHVVIDEVHHLPADTFGPVVSQAPAMYMLSLTATLTRPDGMHPGIKMLSGPVRDRIFPKEAVAASGIAHHYRTRPTAFRLPPELVARARNHEQDILRAMEQDEERNMLLYRDIRAALDRGRSPVLLTKRRDHLDILEAIFKDKVAHMAVFKGGMSQRETDAANIELKAPDGEERLVLAMAQFLGEGFDDARLDSMHLAMPSRFEGTLEQYAGRLQRWHENKDMIEIWDYADVLEPVLLEKADARRKVFETIGFTTMDETKERGAIRDLFEGL
jgi:superfamily II DNA or RNA helicase